MEAKDEDDVEAEDDPAFPETEGRDEGEPDATDAEADPEGIAEVGTDEAMEDGLIEDGGGKGVAVTVPLIVMVTLTLGLAGVAIDEGRDRLEVSLGTGAEKLPDMPVRVKKVENCVYGLEVLVKLI